MPADNQNSPSPEWRSAQHRVRNDLQTLSALLRLSRRRGAEATLLDEFPGWLNGLAAIYDILPLWDPSEAIPVYGLVSALRGRCQMNVGLAPAPAEEVTVPASAGLAVALGVLGLVTFSCQAAAPGCTVTVHVGGDADVARIETIFRAAAPEQPGWPPLSLAISSEALDARYAMGQDGDDTVAVLVVPRR